MADTQSGKFERDDEATRKAAREGGKRSHSGGGQNGDR